MVLGASMAVASTAPVVMNDCVVLGFKLDQCNPPQHMQQPAETNPAGRRSFLLHFLSSREATRCKRTSDVLTWGTDHVSRESLVTTSSGLSFLCGWDPNTKLNWDVKEEFNLILLTRKSHQRRDDSRTVRISEASVCSALERTAESLRRSNSSVSQIRSDSYETHVHDSCHG